jgi:hypothetical protein
MFDYREGYDNRALVHTLGRTVVTARHPYRFRSNPDSDHCLPCCFAMVYEAQAGVHLSMHESERLTGHVSGRPTWSFAAMLALADAGLDVTLIEGSSPQAFMADPEAEVRRLYGDTEAERWVLRHEVLDIEVARLQGCLEHPRISFEVRQPNVEDIRAALVRRASVIVSLNHETLLGMNGYTPHFVVVTELRTSQVVVDNPGLPAFPQQLISLDQFVTAWCSPKPEVANALIVEGRR